MIRLGTAAGRTPNPGIERAAGRGEHQRRPGRCSSVRSRGGPPARQRWGPGSPPGPSSTAPGSPSPPRPRRWRTGRSGSGSRSGGSSPAATRAPSPVVCTAWPITSPPKISQAAVEWNPEKARSGAIPPTVTASRRKISAVKYSGSTAVAQKKPMAMTTTAQACHTPSGPPLRVGHEPDGDAREDDERRDDRSRAHGRGYCMSFAGSDPISPTQVCAERVQICDLGFSRSRWSMVPVRRLKTLGPSPSAAVA